MKFSYHFRTSNKTRLCSDGNLLFGCAEFYRQRHQSLTTEAWTLHESALQSNRVRGNSLYLRDAPEGLFEFE